jgi:hypothetical protein
MTTHLGILILFAACLAAVFGTLLREDGRDQRRLAGRIFLALVAGAYGLGWLMRIAFG